MRSFFWLKFSIFNFFIVALLGVIMRYKILYALPFLDQKHLQDAHSHFAFYGWITTVIYALIIIYIKKVNAAIALKKYSILLIVNSISAYFMLFTFIYGGYFWASILGSSVALLCSFVFAFFFYRDFTQITDASKIWFLGGLFFAVISSLGVFNLGYMKMAGTVSQEMHLASEYYYLHFQYNGFFIFSCIGLLLYSCKIVGAEVSKKANNLLFWLFFSGCTIGVGLSVLWLKMPTYLYSLIILGAFAQTLGASLLFRFVQKNWPYLMSKWTPLQRFLLLFSGFAFAVKIILQLGSTIPELNQFAFGFRNVVIAYLHLVLLMCIATFLLNQILLTGKFNLSRKLQLGIKILLFGIFFNEFVLGLMGIFSIRYIAIPYANEMLLLAAFIMFSALFFIFLNLKNRVVVL